MRGGRPTTSPVFRMNADTLTDLVVHEDYAQVYEHLRHSNMTCPQCFNHVRTFFPEFDEAVSEELSGRKLGGKPALQVISATSSPSAHTIQEVVPPKTDSHGKVVEKARPRTVCESCGVVDYDPTADRGLDGRMRAVGHIADHLHDRYLCFDADAARDVVRECQPYDRLAGHDHAVLERAVAFGLQRVHD